VPSQRPNPFREFASGVMILVRGFKMYGTDPGALVLGMIPALIAGALLIGLFVLLVTFIDALSKDVTWFANGWSTGSRQAIELLAGVSLVGIFALLAIVTFTSVTLAIGDPFYEKISERVDRRLGLTTAAVELPWYREIIRGIGESIRMITISALIGIPLFLCGFIPVVGQTVVPVIGALFGGWFLAVELVGVPFARRGIRLAARRRILRTRRPLAIGFGAAVFLCFLIPLGAILVMPAAVAGGTILARKVAPEGTAALAQPVPSTV
jgi:CysZ protein